MSDFMKTPKRKIVPIFIATLLLSIFFAAYSIQPAKAVAPLDPTTIPKYTEDLVWNIPVYKPTNITVGGVTVEQDYYINVTQFDEQILPTGFPVTTVWGYGGNCTLNGVDIGYFRNSPSATFVATKDIPNKITWVNNLTTVSGALLNYLYPVDPTIMWANPNNIPIENAITLAGLGLAPPYPPGYNGSAILVGSTYTNPLQWNAQSPVPIVTHVHGGEDESTSDGTPNQWYTPNGLHGSEYYTAEPTYPNAAVFVYNNTQEASTIWYHDHALGVTRINVYSGMAGYYIIKDPADPIAPLLPSGTHDIPLAIQDRSFFDNGSLRFLVDAPPNPDVHPFWVPEFFGDTFMVNGKTWPALNVTQSNYRFRVLDGCNARFLNLSLIDLDAANATVPFTMFARDQGYLNATITMNNMLIGPGMRAEILVNFTGIPTGHRILMKNSAAAPFPTGNPVVPGLTDEVIMFKVGGADAATQYTLPATLNPTLAGSTWPTLPAANVVKQRWLTLKEVMGPGGPLMVTQDGQVFNSPTSEFPVIGTTEQWSIINPTADAHPMHWHLNQFQLVSRQPFDDVAYLNTWLTLNGGDAPFNHPTINVGNLSAYYTGPAVAPGPEEQGWLDTVTAWPGQITTVRIRYTQQNGSAYVIDPTVGPGYVWHCHIVDHEDNEMMRKQVVITAAAQPPVYVAARGASNEFWYNRYDFGTSTLGAWTMLPGASTVSSPAIVSFNGTLYCAYADNAGGISFGSVNLTTSAFSGWTVLSGTTPSALTLTNYESKVYLIARGYNNYIYYRVYDTITQTWGGWIGLPDQMTCDSPAAAVIGTNLHIVVRGFSSTVAADNNTLWLATVNLNDNTVSGWTFVPGSTTTAPKLTVPNNQDKVYLTAKGGAGEIFYNSFTGTTWEGWTLLSGATNTSIGVTAANGRLLFMVIGTTGALWLNVVTLSNNAATGWTPEFGTSPSALTLSR